MAIELRNESTNKFTDISSELLRAYLFITEQGKSYKLEIEKPQWLSVSPSGGHRLLDIEGRAYYIPPKWIGISWVVDPDSPHFVK